jgi:hypothetical protein
MYAEFLTQHHDRVPCFPGGVPNGIAHLTGPAAYIVETSTCGFGSISKAGHESGGLRF